MEVPVLILHAVGVSPSVCNLQVIASPLGFGAVYQGMALLVADD